MKSSCELLEATSHPRQFVILDAVASLRPGCPGGDGWQAERIYPRQRPVGLRGSLGRLVELAPDARFFPLAIEYAFWTERGAEALAAFGAPMSGRDLLGLPRPARLARLEAALAATMDRLAADAVARDPTRFVAVLEGKPGIGGVYDAWRRLRAMLHGRRFDAAHGSRGG